MRHYARKRRSMPRTVVQSFKKVLNYAPISRTAASKTDFILSVGQDSVAAGQTGVVDANVPTGSVITGFSIQYCAANIVGGAQFAHLAMQLLRSGQTSLDPRTIGGNPQRNQVFWQDMRSIGINQNANWNIRFKVPKKYQRVREGDQWILVMINTGIVTDSMQIIYKFYR